MTSVKLFRFCLALVLAWGISYSPLFSQEDDDQANENEQAEEAQSNSSARGGGGQGQRGGRGGQAMADLTPEERLNRINAMIQRNVIEMAETVEIREDQQPAFVKAQASYELESFKLRAQAQQAGRDRNKRMEIRGKMQKLGRDTEKAMKEILDKDQFKAFRDKMKERQPQGRGGPGGGGGRPR